MKLSIPNKIILACFGTFNSYGMLRTLNKIGIKPYLILDNRKNTATAKSRYGGPKLFFKTAEEVPGILLEHFSKEDYRPIVICCDDAVQSAVDLRFDDLKEKFILSNIDNRQGAITEMMAKQVQSTLASKCGVLTPKSWVCKAHSEIPTDIIYPCICKPLKSIQGTKDDIRICRDSTQLRDALDSRDYLIQQFIEKDYEVILWGTSVSDGEYYISGVTHKIRQYPTEYGLSSYCVLESFEKHPGLDKNSIIRFLKELKYIGMFSIEMAVKDNRYYMVEINLRNDGKQHFSTVAGANLPLLYISSLLNIPYELPSPRYPTYAMGENTDYRQIFRHKVSFHIWLRDLFRTKSFYIINIKDPNAWLSGYCHKAVNFIKHKLRH